MSATEQDQIWERWRRGESLRLIARQLSKHTPAVRGFVLDTGGIQKRPPTRASRCLSLGEREEISRSLAAGVSMQAIGRQIGRPASTVSREVGRNGGRELYRCELADAAAYQRAKRPKVCKLAVQEALKQTVAAKLELKWSPEQISNWLPLAFPDEPEMRVSHETIYLTLFVQSRGAQTRSCSAVYALEERCDIPRPNAFRSSGARLKTWF